MLHFFSIMELREYIKIFNARKNVIYACVALGFIGAVLFSFVAYQGYTGSLSLIVRPAANEQSADFHYGSYYSLEADDRITRMLEEWLKRQKLDIKILRLGNQYLEITFTQENEEGLKKERDAIVSRAKTFVELLNKFPQSAFEVNASLFETQKQEPSLLLNTGIGIIIGLFVGIFSALFNHYRKNE